MVTLNTAAGLPGNSPVGAGRAGLTAARLGEAWPEVSDRLGRLLARRGVDPVLAQDIVQDVAVRALDKRVPFTDPDDLYRWAAVAARNIHIDHLRTGGRTTEVEALVGMPDDTDIPYAVERRVALGLVWRALAVMRPGEREAILDSLDEQRAARTSGALVRRHRARATLKKAVGGLIAAGAVVRAKVRAVSPMVRTAGAIAILTPVVALDLHGGVAGLGAPGAGTAPLRTTPLVSVARVSREVPHGAPRVASAIVTAVDTAAPASAAGGGARAIPSRTDVRPGPDGAGIGVTQEPNNGQHNACIDGVPQAPDVCEGKVSLPRL